LWSFKQTYEIVEQIREHIENIEEAVSKLEEKTKLLQDIPGSDKLAKPIVEEACRLITNLSYVYAEAPTPIVRVKVKELLLRLNNVRRKAEKYLGVKSR